LSLGVLLQKGGFGCGGTTQFVCEQAFSRASALGMPALDNAEA